MAVDVGGTRSVLFRDWRSARDTLRKWREEGDHRKSDQVVELGTQLLGKHSSRLGDEVWLVHEQVCVAALDCAEYEITEKSLKALKDRFPDSLRVKRLEGMLLEAREMYEEALDFYKEVLGANPTCAPLWKRLVCIHKAQGAITDAIKELIKYLDVYMTDSDGWLELADLYIEQNNYEKAAFCLEELILINPHHHLYHQRYAEICYTRGSFENLELSRKHFAVALKLNPDNMRALYGFLLAAHSLSTHSKSKSKGELKSKNSRYLEWAKAQLMQKYQFNNTKLRIVERMLESMGVQR